MTKPERYSIGSNYALLLQNASRNVVAAASSVPAAKKILCLPDLFYCHGLAFTCKARGMRTITQTILSVVAVAAFCGGGSAKAAFLTEDFDNVPGLFSSGGWVNVNRSAGQGLSPTWFQGNPNVFPAHQGATNSYAGANFQATTGASTISLWMITPVLTFFNGDTITFFTRTVNTPSFPDRLELRLSMAGASTDVGTTPESTGVFSTLLLTVNPNLTTGGYPNTWTQFSATVSGLSGPTDGRVAFRYFVTNGGPNGANSDYIGVDTLRIVPEPSSIALLAFGGIGALVLLRRRTRGV